MALTIDQINPAGLPEAGSTYTHGTVVGEAQRLVFVSGQPPWARDAPPPDGFEAQCRLAWRNVEQVLIEAGLSLRNLAKITTYLSDRRYGDDNIRIRAEVLGDHVPAITVIIADIYRDEWLIEIEGIAVA
jgi:2-iminobutanoate/2-iminopropanoate deaminase